jgi:hypothetical protein
VVVGAHGLLYEYSKRLSDWTCNEGSSYTIMDDDLAMKESADHAVDSTSGPDRWSD